jgi:hypothetical protein
MGGVGLRLLELPIAVQVGVASGVCLLWAEKSILSFNSKHVCDVSLSQTGGNKKKLVI